MDKKYFMGLEGFAWFVGVVEDRNDPHKLGRVRVRAVGYHTDDKEKIPTEDLPWAHIMMPTTTPSMSGLGVSPSWMVEGTWVVGFFRDIHEKQQPVIMGTLPGVPQEEADPSKGFNDPSGVFPLVDDEYSGHTLKESDLNRLARADEKDVFKHKILDAKEASRTTGVPTANDGESWDEPESTYAAKYPLNHVMETESGHIVEYDDTPDAERIQQLHKAGTFYEIDKDGNKVERIVKDNYEVVFGDDYMNVKGNVNLTIGANCKTYIAGNWDIQVDGNVREVIKGTMTQEVTGDVTETYSANQVKTVSGDNTANVSGDSSEDVGGTKSTTSGSDTNISAGGNVNVTGTKINLN